MKDGAVVIALPGKADKVFHRHGGRVRVQNRPDLPFGGVEDGNGVALGRAGELSFSAFHGGTVHAAGQHAATAAARQQQARGQGQPGQAQDRFVHGIPPRKMSLVLL